MAEVNGYPPQDTPRSNAAFEIPQSATDTSITMLALCRALERELIDMDRARERAYKNGWDRGIQQQASYAERLRAALVMVDRCFFDTHDEGRPSGPDTYEAVCAALAQAPEGAKEIQGKAGSTPARLPSSGETGERFESADGSRGDKGTGGTPVKASAESGAGANTFAEPGGGFAEGFRIVQQAAQRLSMQVGQYDLAKNIGKLRPEDYEFMRGPSGEGLADAERFEWLRRNFGGVICERIFASGLFTIPVNGKLRETVDAAMGQRPLRATSGGNSAAPSLYDPETGKPDMAAGG